MQLVTGPGSTGAFLAFVNAACGSPATVADGPSPSLSVGGSTLTSPVAIAKALAPSLAGATPAAEAAVTQWVSWALSPASAEATALDALTAHLTTASYVAGNAYTVADIAVYFACHAAMLAAGPKIAAKRPLARWLRQFLAEPGRAGVATAAGAPGAPLRVPPAGAVKVATSAPAAPAAAAAAAPAAAATSAAPKLAAAAGGDKKEKAAAGGKGGEGKGAAAAPAAAAPAAAAAGAEEDYLSQCDFRVGVITKVWVHPDADKLYCEEIDVGDATGPRQIASGLRAHYTLEEMSGRRVVVITNLKPRPLVGFTSAGMVLAATAPDTGKVELLAPPAGAAVGERVTFAGHIGEAADFKKMDKKKIFDKVAPGLKVNADGVATWEGVPFGTSAGPCTALGAKGGLIK